MIRLLTEQSDAGLHCLIRPICPNTLNFHSKYCGAPTFGYFPVALIRIMLKQFIFRSHFLRLIHRLTLIHVDFKRQDKIDGQTNVYFNTMDIYTGVS